jgi:hypothetical protein
VLCNVRAHNLVIKCPAFKESQPVKCKKPNSAVLNRVNESGLIDGPV